MRAPISKVPGLDTIAESVTNTVDKGLNTLTAAPVPSQEKLLEA